MKLKLTILLFFVASSLYPQKQIQPYNFSVSQGEKTETILIYASASSTNNITFTLKDASNKVLINNYDEELIFKVFPFTEVSFRRHIMDAIEHIKSNKDGSNNNFQIFKDRINKIDNSNLEKRNTIIEDFRNIYQFFNALVITAFEYDNEPVAGVLKYSLNTKITKKNIEGLDSDLYFYKKAKELRSYIFDNANKLENCNPENKYEGDPFIKTVLDEHSCLFLEFHNNTKGTKSHRAKVKFKHFAEKKLKELYNVYGMEGFTQGDFLLNYSKFKNEILIAQRDNDSFSMKIKLIRKNENPAEKKIRDSIIKLNENLVFQRDILVNKLNKTMETEQSLKIKIQQKKENSGTELSDEILTLKNLAIVIGDSIVYFDTKLDLLNKLIKDNKKNLEYAESKITSSKSKIDILEFDTKSNEDKIKKNQFSIDSLISVNKSKFKKLPFWNFKVETIEIDINDGFIEHITVVGKLQLPVIDESLINLFTKLKPDKKLIKQHNPQSLGYIEISTIKVLENFYQERLVKQILNGSTPKELKFENEFPIGFSSKSDFADLSNYNLFAFEGSEKIFSLPITDVITEYIQRHENDRLNFSPRDQVVRLPQDDFSKSNTVELKKEISSKILNINIYSDFLGLKENNPNGLLQF